MLHILSQALAHFFCQFFFAGFITGFQIKHTLLVVGTITAYHCIGKIFRTNPAFQFINQFSGFIFLPGISQIAGCFTIQGTKVEQVSAVFFIIVHAFAMSIAKAVLGHEVIVDHLIVIVADLCTTQSHFAQGAVNQPAFLGTF